MRWRPVLEGLAFLVGVAALVGGCLAVARLPWDDDLEPARTKMAGSLQVLIDAEPDPDAAYAGVGAGGRVAIVGDGCLGVKVGRTQIVVAWPYGSKIEGEDKEATVTTPKTEIWDGDGDPHPAGGVKVKVGDHVSGGIPAYRGSWGPQAKYWPDDLSSGCGRLPLWQLSDIEVASPRDGR